MELSRRQFLTAGAVALAACNTDKRLGSPPMTAASPVRAAPTTSTTFVTPTVEVIERTAWGAAPPGSGMVEHVITRLTIHHTAVELTDNRLAPERLRTHQRFHQTERGWPDLAYHLAIDLKGNVYEGRPLRFRGDTATAYDPTGHLLVVLEGNFDVQPLGPDQQSSAQVLLAWAAVRYDIDPAEIGCHRDYAATSCPGDAAHGVISSGDLRRSVQDMIDLGAPELHYLRGRLALERIAGIEAPGVRRRTSGVQ